MNNALFVAWRAGGNDDGCWGPVGRLEHLADEGVYRFVYTRGAKTLPGFRPFPEMPKLEAVYESEELLPLFSNRLLSKSRPEYQSYLTWSGFNSNDPPDHLALLAVTEGRRATDSIELFPCPQPDADGCFINKFFLRGVRHRTDAELARVEQLKHGEELLLEAEEDNPRDGQAMKVLAVALPGGDGEPIKIGYVPRYLARDAGELLNQCGASALSVSVDRVNPNAPLQQRVLCRMTACWPEDFRPCDRDEFVPIVGAASHVGS